MTGAIKRNKAEKGKEGCHLRQHDWGGLPDEAIQEPGPGGEEDSEQRERPVKDPMVVHGTVRKPL